MNDLGLFNPPALRDNGADREAVRRELRETINRGGTTEEVLPLVEELEDLEEEAGITPGQQSQALYDLRARDFPRVNRVRRVKIGTGKNAPVYHEAHIETRELEVRVFVNGKGEVIPHYVLDKPAFRFKDRTTAAKVAELAREAVRRADK